MSDAEQIERRLADLEETVRGLASELAQLRTARSDAPAAAGSNPAAAPAETAARSPSAAGATQPPPQAERPWSIASTFGGGVDFESLIGRYGTLVLATISALAAVGLFLGWAIDKGLLGPTQRIALGLLTAAALAVGGLRLRRTERSFGASLLGLALAVVHVCLGSGSVPEDR
jgi:uncharacterized membrane protein